MAADGDDFALDVRPGGTAPGFDAAELPSPASAAAVSAGINR